MDFSDIWDDHEVEALEEQLAVANLMADYFKEAYADTARGLLAAEDIGWNRLGGASSQEQVTLDDAKRIAKRLHGYRESNPLLSRGLEIRNSYQFSGMYSIGTREAESRISSQKWGLINDEKNQNAVFSLEALERIEGERYSAGQAFLLFDRGAKAFQHISFQEIGDIIYDPDDSSEIRYVMREWGALEIQADGSERQVTKREYYPSSRFDAPAGGYAKSIKGVAVVDTKRMIVERVNMKAGANLGIPDSFSAAPWALAYSAYLSDGSKVLAALAEWAWVVKPKKRPAAERAAATVRSERGAGGTLFTDMDVQSLPTSKAVDLDTGRPIAAQAASGLGVSVVLLLADPGSSGAYGVAQTLSDPNRRTMEARRERNTKLLEHCLTLLGVKDPEVQWPKMSPGSDADEQSIVMQAWGSGLFHEDEVRGRLADLAHITIEHSNPPEGFMYPNNSESLARADIDADGVKPDGSTGMSNGQGRDSQGIGNLSHAKKSGTTQGGSSDG